jgi:hypothetical protein
MNNQLRIGIAWFDREQWNRLTEVVPDRSELDDTFEAWERSARKAIKNFERNGQTIEKVQIKVEELLAWCLINGTSPNGASRSNYVSEVLKIRESKKS